MDEHTIVDQIGNDVFANTRSRIRGELGAEIERKRTGGDFDDSQHSGGARRMVEIIVDGPSDDGAVRFRFVQWRKRYGLLRLEKTSALLEGPRSLCEAHHRDAVPVSDCYGIVPS